MANRAERFAGASSAQVLRRWPSPSYNETFRAGSSQAQSTFLVTCLFLLSFIPFHIPYLLCERVVSISSLEEESATLRSVVNYLLSSAP
jgi:hypothetical protein